MNLEEWRNNVETVLAVLLIVLVGVALYAALLALYTTVNIAAARLTKRFSSYRITRDGIDFYLFGKRSALNSVKRSHIRAVKIIRWYDIRIFVPFTLYLPTRFSARALLVTTRGVFSYILTPDDPEAARATLGFYGR